MIFSYHFTAMFTCVPSWGKLAVGAAPGLDVQQDTHHEGEDCSCGDQSDKLLMNFLHWVSQVHRSTKCSQTDQHGIKA